MESEVVCFAFLPRRFGIVDDLPRCNSNMLLEILRDFAGDFSVETIKLMYRDFNNDEVNFRHEILCHESHSPELLRWMMSKRNIVEYISMDQYDSINGCIDWSHSGEWLDAYYSGVEIEFDLNSRYDKLYYASASSVLWLASRLNDYHVKELYKIVKKSKNEECVIAMIQKYPEVIGLSGYKINVEPL